MIRILVADDEAVFRRGLISCADWINHGIEVVGEADNGQKAIELIRALKPDVVLLDIKMPVMDGVEVVKIIMPELPDTKIIMLSCLNDLESVRSSMKLGAKDYLFKPIVSPKDIINAILELFPHNQQEIIIDPHVVKNVILFIEQNYMYDITLDDLAKVACLSKNYFCTLFNKETGSTPIEYLTNYRIRIADQLLANTQLSLARIAELVGIPDYVRFSKTYKKINGMPPVKARKT